MRWAAWLALAWLWCAPASAQEGSALPLAEIGRAATCYNSLSYECVVERLEALPARFWPSAPGRLPEGARALDLPILLDAGRILAVSLLALGRAEEARAVFVWLLRLDPGFVLGGSEIPPRFVLVFLEERAKVVAPPVAAGCWGRAAGRAAGIRRGVGARAVAEAVGALPKPAPPLPPVIAPPPPPERLGLRAGALWQALTGEDAATYRAAPGWQAGAELYWGEWSLGLEAAQSRHEVALGDLLVPGERALRLFHVEAVGGYTLRAGIFGLRPELGLGASLVGVERAVEGVGLSSLARLGGSARLYGPWSLGLGAELRGVSVVARGRWRTSALPGGALWTAVAF